MPSWIWASDTETPVERNSTVGADELRTHGFQHSSCRLTTMTRGSKKIGERREIPGEVS